MPRKERLFVAGMPQLVAFKGNNNEIMFRDEDDARFFLSCLRNACARHVVRLHAFSLLQSQIFLLLTADDKAELARFIQFLGRSYVPWFNRRHGRSGVLWEGRYRSCSVEASNYFLLCQKYIELRAGDQSGAPWNSSGVYTGREALDFLTPHPLYLALAADAALRHSRYRQFLSVPLGSSFIYRIEECLRQNCVLGTLNYCLELENRLHVPVRPRSSGRPRKHYPDRLDYWLWFEQEASHCIKGFDYHEINLPLLDGGAGREGEWAAMLRSDGTMGCLNVIAEQHIEDLPARLWYQGPMFRTHHLGGQQVEQYHQIGAEALGLGDIDIELEHLLIQHELIQRLKLPAHLELQINTLGSPEELQAYRLVLRAHFAPLLSGLDPLARASLESAPEVLLGDMPGVPEALRQSAPALAPFLSDASLARFDRLTSALSAAGVSYTHRVDLFPHRPYYQQTFYEWHSPHLEARPVVCRGGRYDEVASRIMGRPTPACGFAFMVEPMIQLAEKSRSNRRPGSQRFDITILCDGTDDAWPVLHLARELREAFPYLSVVNDFGRGRVSAKRKRALKGGARLILSLQEVGRAELYDTTDHETVLCSLDETVSHVRRRLS